MSINQLCEGGTALFCHRENQILSAKDGVGGCIKCHAVTEVKNSKGDAKLVVKWNYAYSNYRPYVRYKHENHIEMLGTKNSCSNCHILDKEIDYMASFKEYDPVKGVSNFSPIKKKTCMQCHSEKQIDLKCQKCHLYHFKPSFKQDMLAVKAESPASKL